MILYYRKVILANCIRKRGAAIMDKLTAILDVLKKFFEEFVLFFEDAKAKLEAVMPKEEA